MHSYVRHLKALFQKHADPTQAVPMKKYMRDQFEFLGIKSPQVKALLRQYIQQSGMPPLDDLDAVIRDLWRLPQREFQYAAISLMEKLEKKLPAKSISTIEYMITHKSWWDTVDNVSHVVGVHFRRYPGIREKYLTKWRASQNIWLRRGAILFQLDYKTETDFGLLSEIIRENLNSKEFFINKAIGWALRQYARVDPDAVKEFVASTSLHSMSKSEALKKL